MDKRETILQAASRAFATKGFHDSKVEEIASVAGVAKGTVYLYFKDKSTLLYEVLHYTREKYKHGLEEETERYTTAYDKLLGYTRFHLAQFPNMVKLHKLNMEQLTKFHNDPSSRRRMKDEQEGMMDFLTQIVQLGMDSGEFRTVNARDAALLCWGAMHANVHWAMVNEVEEIDSDRAEGIVNLILSGIGK
ncbi:TetR/AcrR family transcriptional regulator [Tumebacillus permanentifrigoris]|nr:TetR/AcrR family transcriptional regulator [Tumebacillus permanentifrigoris]